MEANNNSNGDYNIQHSPSHFVKHVEHSKTKKVVLTVLILLLIASSVVLGYLYYQKSQEVSDLQNQSINSADNSKSEQANEATGDEVATLPAKQTTYTAEVGKFTLTLSPEYAVIENWDGGFEGGPVTSIGIGKTVDDQHNVYTGNKFQGVGLSARPGAVYGSEFSTYVDSRLTDIGAEQSKKADIEIDGVTAQVYEVRGLFDSEYTFFENNGLYYEIEVIGVSESGSNRQTQDELVAGFKFN